MRSCFCSIFLCIMRGIRRKKKCWPVQQKKTHKLRIEHTDLYGIDNNGQFGHWNFIGKQSKSADNIEVHLVSWGHCALCTWVHSEAGKTVVLFHFIWECNNTVEEKSYCHLNSFSFRIILCKWSSRSAALWQCLKDFIWPYARALLLYSATI